MKRGILLLIVFMSFTVLANAQDGTKKEFKPNGKVFGVLFGDYYYKLGSSNDKNLLDGKGEYKKRAKDDNAFSLRRLYLGYKYNFNKKFSAKLMFEGNDGNLIAGEKRGVNIKYYYLQWKNFLPNADLIIGAQSTPTWSRFTEKIWGYRDVEKTIMDFRGLGVSNDFGVSLSGKLTKNKIIGYELMIGNGTAQKLEKNKNKKIYAAVNARLLNKRLLLEAYYDQEKDKNGKALITYKAFIGFTNELLTVGIEPFQKVYYITDKQTAAFGSTFFVRGTIIKGMLNGLVRYDLYDGDKNNIDLSDINHAYSEGFLVAGFDYTPVKNVNIIPNIWINTYGKKANSSYSEKANDIVARVTFNFKF